MNPVREAGRAETKGLPFSGVGVVFRRQMRSRRAWRDLLWACVLLAALLALSAVLQATWAQESVYSGAPPQFLLRWLTIGAAGAAFIVLPCAAILGAGAVPSSAEFEATQSALLTRLTPFDIVAGRLLAALWPLLSSLLASCAFWLTAQLFWRFVPGAWDGFGPIVEAHVVLIMAVAMIGAVGFLFAERRRPGRAWIRGATVALLLAALCVTALFLVNPLIRRMKKPERLIEGALLLNPVSAVTASLDLDILRTPWLYDHTDAPDYPILYPSPWISACLFAGLSFGAQALSATRLRRAYR